VHLLQIDASSEHLTSGRQTNDYQPWSGEARRRSKSNAEIIVNTSTTALKDETGAISGYISVSHDITEQKRLREQHDHLASIVEQSSEAIFSRGSDRKLISWNKGAEKLMGYTRDEAIGKTITELGAMRLTADEINEIEASLRNQGTWETEKKYYRKNGTSFIGAVTAYTLKADDGRSRDLVFIVKDISERKRLEEQLTKSHQDMEAFSYSVSHDLRAPLRGIIGFTTVLEEDYAGKLDEEARRICGVIRNNTLKMGSLIDDLLAFSRMGRHDLNKMRFDTNGLVREVIASLDKKSSDSISWKLNSLPASYGDLTTIRQVWINLLSNAVKYSSRNTAPAIEIGSYQQEDDTVYFVRDNGVGFDQKYSNKLFKVFQRLHSSTEFEGTGVGLAIIEKIISKHGGRVWAEGEPGKGAVFFFSLPAQALTTD
jgi:PAS domain S-box-containing protein